MRLSILEQCRELIASQREEINRLEGMVADRDDELEHAFNERLKQQQLIAELIEALDQETNRRYRPGHVDQLIKRGLEV